MLMSNTAHGTREAEHIDADELARIVAGHEKFMADHRQGARAVLHAKNLARVDLSNRNLSQADLAGSTLNHAHLKFTYLARSNLYCCEMMSVDARYAHFEDADLRGATLNGSNLSHARLDRADFRSGRLMKDVPGGGAVIDRNGSATGADFSNCSLNGTHFDGADLRGADFSGAIIIGTNFHGARLTEASFKGAILVNVNLSDLPPEAIKDSVLPPTRDAIAAKDALIFQLNAHKVWVESSARLGSCGVFDGQDLRPLAPIIGKFKLTAISARGVNAAGVDFSCTELQGANFENADLRGASFEGADLRGVRFTGALLHHAKFHGADMRPLQLKRGGILPCELTGTSFTDEQRAEAIFD